MKSFYTVKKQNVTYYCLDGATWEDYLTVNRIIAKIKGVTLMSEMVEQVWFANIADKQAIETILKENGYEKGGKAKDIINYHKERGSLRDI